MEKQYTPSATLYLGSALNNCVWKSPTISNNPVVVTAGTECEGVILIEKKLLTENGYNLYFPSDTIYNAVVAADNTVTKFIDWGQNGSAIYSTNLNFEFSLWNITEG